VNTLFKFTNDKKTRFLAYISIVSIIYTSILVYTQSIIGISYWDIFVYLDNAMLFSHINIGSQLSVPPILSLVTSIFFQLGFISENTLFIVSGIFFVFLLIGIYILFCRRFTPEESFISTIIFSMFSLVVTWAVSGSNDLPALSLAVWTIIFALKAVDDHYIYYFIAFLSFILTFFTRFTEGFVFLLMLFILIIDFKSIKKQITTKRLALFISFIALIGLVIAGIYISYMHTIPFISQFLEVSSSSQVSSVNVGYDLNPWYYIENLPQYITCLSISNEYVTTLSTSSNIPTLLSYVIIALSAVGIVTFLKSSNIYRTHRLSKQSSMIIILSLIMIFSYLHISYIITEILFMVILLLYYRYNKKYIDKLDILMIFLLGIFIILHSYHPVKVDRYIVPILIPITYYMTIAIKQITQKLHLDKKTPLIILCIILIILVPINCSYITSLQHENPHTTQEKSASQWLKNYDENYTTKNISSDRGVVFSWYLKKYTYTTIERVLKSTNQTLKEKLDSINATYYIDSSSNLAEIEDYHVIFEDKNQYNTLKIYERNNNTRD